MRSIALALALLTLPSTAPSAAIAATPTEAAAAESASLRTLFADSDEAQLKRNPLFALFRGDLRYSDQFGDFISDDYYAGERAAARSELARLAAIDRSKLGADDQLSYDVFKFTTSDTLAGLEPGLLRTRYLRPIDHFFGFQVFMPDIVSGEGAAPFKTVKDYDDNLKRVDGYVAYLDRAITRMRAGLAAGVTNPQLVMQNVVNQLDGMVAQGVEGSTFYKPVTIMPDSFSAAGKARLTAAYAAMVRDKVNPAHARLRDFLRDDYLPKARTTVGLAQMPGGAALYAYLVKSTTTTDLTPDAIHSIGLAEVARIRTGMEAIKGKTGFKGSLADFFVFMRTDPRFRPASSDAMRDAFYAIDKRMLAAIGREFSTIPKSPLEIRPVPAYKEKTDAAGSYQQGTPDGSRPGVFFFNAYNLPSRSTWGYETLFLHEGAPGHHFQISLAQEATALPPFQRFGGNTAYVEGWALYAESLGPTLGFFTDPYQLYGHLNDEMLRAMRLVVDTGIHSKGWSRDKAIAYMLDNSAMSRNDATVEVERYIAIPSQALAYKIGALTIQRLRKKSETALGARFDPREFHAQVLMTGALPMAVLEAKIDRWIESKRG